MGSICTYDEISHYDIKGHINSHYPFLYGISDKEFKPQMRNITLLQFVQPMLAIVF